MRSIKRVSDTNNYVIRTFSQGVKLLTISDLHSNLYTYRKLLDVQGDADSYSHSLSVDVSPTHIAITTIGNEGELFSGPYKASVY